MAAQAREIPLPLPADDIFDSNTHNTLAITVPSRDPSVSRSCARPWFSLVLFNSCLASTVTVSAGTLPLQSLSIDRCNQLHKIKVILRLSASHGHTSCILASQCTVGAFCNQVYASPQSLGCEGAAPDYTWQEKGISSTGGQIECSKATAQLHTDVDVYTGLPDGQWRSACLTTSQK